MLRLLYLQKRESLSASADQVLVTVEEVQAELQKMNLPRRLDQLTLEKLLRTLRRSLSNGGNERLRYFCVLLQPKYFPHRRVPLPT